VCVTIHHRYLLPSPNFLVLCRGSRGGTDGAEALLFYHERMSESDAEFLLRATATDGMPSAQVQTQ
jgi:hypothetical protein